MARFNPFTRVDSKYGAPMGRHGHDISQYDGVSKLYARHGGGDGYYDRGGAYWGHSDIYAVWTRGGDFCTYVDGVDSPEDAIAKVKEIVGAVKRYTVHGRSPRKFDTLEEANAYAIRYARRTGNIVAITLE